MRTIREFFLPNRAATEKVGAALARSLTSGMVLYLEGDLGAGKTTLVRAVLRALGYLEPVKSPTYTLVEPHVISGLYFYHFDFYRFTSPEEFLDAGLDEYFRRDTICLVEWPDQAKGRLPAADLCLSLYEPPRPPSPDFAEDSPRKLSLFPVSAKGAQCLEKLLSFWNAETF
ncbi:MAG: tRNA (adenosine(37)-N6)-threonylcarbamoyltransferase complex ATPase subunit type 1 TsaE [Zoogloeaceae bacterium]|jgi:tRNA threonylcarbamoyladenosine biosynthesis protein TsaE|nr:tRNA (adenosine(37)-N6)-threonylcarbamoyltransferase complex ATPase subunit type 1 TsaE [Zoogloeaceae bacterium]